MEKHNDIKLTTTFARIVAYTLLAAFSAMVIQHDANILINGQKFTEHSYTEWMQLTYILVISLLLYFIAKSSEPLRPIAYLLTGGFVVVLIRELDHYLDVIYNGAWLPPALVVFAGTIWVVFRHRHQLTDSTRHLISTPAFGLFVAGWLGIFVFSRLFGYKGIWLAVFQVETLDPRSPFKWAKNAVEEGTELFGYCLMLCAAIELLTYVRRCRKLENGS